MPEPTMTHPETAWIVGAVPLFLTLAALLLTTLIGHGQLLLLCRRWLVRAAARRTDAALDDNLRFVPPIMSPDQFLGAAVAACLTGVILLWYASGLLLAVVSAPVLMIVTLWGLLRLAELRYVARLDAQLINAVGRLSMLLTGGTTIAPAFDALLADLPPSPLRAEWTWVRQRLGTPLRNGQRALPEDVVAALLVQTPSQRHAAFLQQLEIALGQTQQILARRVQAAASALQRSAQRQSQTVTALNHMKLTAIVIGCGGLAAQIGMALLMRERWLIAFGSTIGLIVAALIIFSLLGPIALALALSRADDLDY